MAQTTIAALTADSALDGTEKVPVVDGSTTKRTTVLDIYNLRAAATVPASGTWVKGDRVYNSSPDAGEAIGWVCITAGAPGTWRPLGFIPGATVTVTGATATIAVTDGPTIADRAGTVALTLPSAAAMAGYEGKDFPVKGVQASETNIVSFVAGDGTTLEASHTIEGLFGSLTWYLDGTVWRVK